MKILRVADVPDNRTGGVSRAMYGTGDALARLGHHVDYVFREQLASSVHAKLRRFAVPLALVPLVRRMHLEASYDIVEIHEPLAAAYCIARRADRRLPPLAVFSHGLEDRGHSAELDYLRRKGLGPTLKQRVSPLSVTWQAAYAVTHADHVICLNSQDRAHLLRRGVADEDVTVLHSGVDEALLLAAEGAQQRPRAATRDASVLFLGTWILRKGSLDLAAAMSTVLRRNAGARLTIAGCHVPPATVRAVFDSDLHARIEVIPKIEGAAPLAELYARHSIFVLPSYYEGHPIVMVEAAAFSLAIVTTPICGMGDFILDGSNGRLVGVGEAQRLADVTLELLGDAGQRSRLGAAAHATAQRHTWTAAAQPLLAAYRRAAARHGSRLASGSRKLRPQR